MASDKVGKYDTYPMWRSDTDRKIQVMQFVLRNIFTKERTDLATKINIYPENILISKSKLMK